MHASLKAVKQVQIAQ